MRPSVLLLVVVLFFVVAGVLTLTVMVEHTAPTPTPRPTVKPTIKPTINTPLPTEPPLGATVDVATDKTNYMAGDTATITATVKAGDQKLDGGELDVVVSKYILFGYVEVGNGNIAFNDTIRPGETKTITYNVTIPVEYHGVPTNGDYTITAKVISGGTMIGERVFSITVT